MIKSQQELCKILENIHIQAGKKLNGDFYNKGPNLYHYTSLDSALNILRTGSLFASDANYCNDPSEIINGLKLLNQAHESFEQIYKNDVSFFFDMSFIVDFLTNTNPCGNLVNNSGNKYAKTLGVDLPNTPLKTSHFITCFSEKNDDLRQWIPYSDDAQGVAIGFKGFNETHDITEANVNIYRVAYNNDEEKISYLKTIYKELSKIHKLISPDLRSVFVNLVISGLSEDLVACKTENYKDEYEWRLAFAVVTDDEKKNIDYQHRRGLIKPYIPIKFNKDSVIEIKLGPKTEKILNKRSLQALLKKYGYKNTEITESEIEYR